MFFGAKQSTFQKADELRENMTQAELTLWWFLKTKPLGVKFRRQHPIGSYIADFYSHKLKLVIEVDGGIHLNKEVAQNDIARQINIESEGIRILRFTNDEIEKDIKAVIHKIEEYIQNINR